MAWRSRIPRPGTLNGVEMVVLSIAETTPNRVVVQEFPGVAGAELEDLGVGPRTFNIEAMVFGATWFAQLQGLRDAAKASGEHTFNHPFWGLIRGKCQSCELVVTAEEHDTARVRLSFVEGEARLQVLSLSVSAAAAAEAVRAASLVVSSTMAVL